MPQLRITDYFRPLNDPGPSSPAPSPAPARAPRPARGGPAAPELQARAPRPYSTQALNRDHARVDPGAKFAAFSERMRREQTLPAPAHEPASATPPEPLYILTHTTRPAPAPAHEPASATPPEPLYVLTHTTQPPPAPAAGPSSTTPTEPLYVLTHTAQAHAPQQPLYYVTHDPHPVHAHPFAPRDRNLYFGGGMYNLLSGLPNRFLPRRRGHGNI